MLEEIKPNTTRKRQTSPPQFGADPSWISLSMRRGVNSGVESAQPMASRYRERMCAENYNKWHNKFTSLKLQSAFW